MLIRLNMVINAKYTFLFVLILYVPVNDFTAMSGQVFLG